jgi:hypothetical protein
MGNDKWEMENRKWKIGNGKSEMEYWKWKKLRYKLPVTGCEPGNGIY